MSIRKTHKNSKDKLFYMGKAKQIVVGAKESR